MNGPYGTVVPIKRVPGGWRLSGTLRTCPLQPLTLRQHLPFFLCVVMPAVTNTAPWLSTLSARLDDGWFYGHTGAGNKYGLVSAHHVEIISSLPQKGFQVIDVKKLKDEQKTKEGWTTSQFIDLKVTQIMQKAVTQMITEKNQRLIFSHIFILLVWLWFLTYF